MLPGACWGGLCLACRAPSRHVASRRRLPQLPRLTPHPTSWPSLPPTRRLPARVKHSYSYLHSERHYSDLTLLAGLLAVPVMLGLTCICLLDAVYCRPLPPPTPRPRPHFE